MVSLVFSLLSAFLLSLSSAAPLSDTPPLTSFNTSIQASKPLQFQLLISNSTTPSLNSQTVQAFNNKFFIGESFAPNDTVFTSSPDAPFMNLNGEFVGVLDTYEFFTAFEPGAVQGQPKKSVGFNIALNWDFQEVEATLPGATGEVLGVQELKNEWYTCKVAGEAATVRQIFVDINDGFRKRPSCELFVPAVKFVEGS